MIQNDLQYRVTKAQWHRFELALLEQTFGEGQDENEKLDPALVKLHHDALTSERDELAMQLCAWENAQERNATPQWIRDATKDIAQYTGKLGDEHAMRAIGAYIRAHYGLYRASV